MTSAQRLATLGAIALVLQTGCDSTSKSGAAPSVSSLASSPTPSGSGDDQLPAIEVKPASPPRYSLAKLTQLELAALVSKHRWTTTAIGKTPGSASESAIRVNAFKKDAEGMLECSVSVRCLEGGEPPVRGSAAAREHPVGEAYYAETPCELQVEVRRGIRKKSAESKRLLEQLLASQPG